MDVRRRMIEGIERIVKAECEASQSPRPPEFEYFDQYPLTENDAELTEKITSAFRNHFGTEEIFELGRVTASEDFSYVPDAFGAPYTFWGIGGIDPEKYDQARRAGRIAQDIPVNHSEFFAPVIQPTLSVGTEALVVAAMTYLAK
jgi:metal-dependent amidase/aminoacylase/carboxypeptidase family protein